MTSTRIRYDKCIKCSKLVLLLLLCCPQHKVHAIYAPSSNPNMAHSIPVLDCRGLFLEINGTDIVPQESSGVRLSDISEAYSAVEALSSAEYFCLDLKNNNLTCISADAFAANVFNRMLSLNLNSNFISIIEVGAFSGLNTSSAVLSAVYLQGNLLTSLPHDFLNGLSVELLDLSANQFIEAPMSVINSAQLSKLQMFSLANNMLTHIDLMSLNGMVLTTVILSHNRLTQIEYESFSRVQAIVALNAESNLLTSLPLSFGCIQHVSFNNNPGIAELPQLDCVASGGWFTMSLSLSGSSITTISPSTFSRPRALPLIYLEDFDLRNSLLEVIESGTFAYLTKISNLFLSGNRLATLDGVFGNVSITYLDVAYNRITEIGRSSLPILTQLESLLLQGNFISTVSADTFGAPEGTMESFINLIYINLANNQLSVILPSTFARCIYLSSLDVADNQLTSLNASAFIGLTSLSTLNLARNRISSIMSDTFPSLETALTYVDLSGNSLTVLTANISSSLSMVETVRLTNNEITLIEAGVLAGATGILSLDLGMNQLSAINNETFRGMVKLQSLDVSNNRITSWTEDAFGSLAALEVVAMNGNPIVCNVSGLFITSGTPTNASGTPVLQCYGCQASFEDDPTLPYVFTNGTACATGWGTATVGTPATYLPSEFSTSPAAAAATIVAQPSAQWNLTVGQLYIVHAPNLTSVTYGGIDVLAGSVDPDYAVRFGATQLPTGVSIQPSTGVISGVPLVAGATVTQTYIYLASYPRATLVLGSVVFDVQYADTDNRSGHVYGPQGMPCLHEGTPVDIVPYDRAYTCACPIPYTGPNCNASVPTPTPTHVPTSAPVATPKPPPASVRQPDSTSADSSGVAVGALAGAVGMCMVVIAALWWSKSGRKFRASEFKLQLLNIGGKRTDPAILPDTSQIAPADASDVASSIA